MKITMKFLTYGLLLTALVITSCTKEGPQGPAGIAGANGTNGTNGNDGQDGQNGISNIITSDWFETAWTLPDDKGFHDVAVPALTQDILNNSAIMVYMKGNFFGEDVVHPLPVFFRNGTTPTSYRFFAHEGNINISFSADAPANSTFTTFKYIIIPTGNTAGKSSSGGKGNVLAELKAKGVDINDYYAMMDYLGKDY